MISFLYDEHIISNVKLDPSSGIKRYFPKNPLLMTILVKNYSAFLRIFSIRSLINMLYTGEVHSPDQASETCPDAQTV